MASDEMTPFGISREFAAKLVAKGEFSEGGWRLCPKCNKSHEVSAKQIEEWFATKLPRCKVCDSRTQLLSRAEHERKFA